MSLEEKLKDLDDPFDFSIKVKLTYENRYRF